MTKDLQNQIRYLCREVRSEEWSGILFYETEGEFGEDSFSMTAKGLYLMDIGSSTYTEYDPADEKFIKFLMNNPEALKMKKGHIHSHNTMDVFFSGTDDNELIDNCGYHNFYLSLIVNNKHEMCAKVAFKAKIKSEINEVMYFKNQNGANVEKAYNSNKEIEAVYTFKCDIEKEDEVVEDAFKGRFQEIKEEKSKVKSTALVLPGPITGKALQGFNVDQRWRQHGLFDDVKGSLSYHEEWEKWKEEKEGEKKDKTSIVSKGMKTDPRIYSMLGKMIQLDSLYEGSLIEALKKLDGEFYPKTDYSGPAGPSYSIKLYFDTVEKRALDFYMESFPEDKNLTGFNKAMDTCRDILDSFLDDYPELVVNLTEALELEITK